MDYSTTGQGAIARAVLMKARLFTGSERPMGILNLALSQETRTALISAGLCL
jgi:hypothetical protein